MPGKSFSVGKVLEAVVLAVAFAFYIFPLQDKEVVFTFQVRDIARALELVRGHQVFFGPEVTGGGHLPGGFYYYLLSLPLAFGLGWKGTWLLLVIFLASSLGLLWYFFRSFVGGWVPAFFAMLCFGSAFPIWAGTRLILNSAFVFPFVVLMLAGLCLAYSREVSETTRVRAVCVSFFSLALGLQLHLSLLSLVPAFLLLQLLNGKGGIAQLSFAKYFRSMLFLFPLLPFPIWRLLSEFGWKVGQQPPVFAGVSGLGNFYKYSYGNFTSQAWEANLYFGFWHALKEVLLQLHRFVFDTGGLTFPCYLISFLWLGRFVYRTVRDAKVDCDPSLLLFLCTIFAMIPGVIGAGSGGMGVRYSGVTSLSYIFFCAAALESLLRSWRLASPWIPGALSIASVFYLAQFGARSERILQKYDGVFGFDTLTPASAFESLSRQVVASTGWPYSKFRERAFLLNVFNEITLQTEYEEVEGSATSKQPEPDGYFVAQRRNSQELEASQKDLKAWLATQRIPANLAEGLRSGGIVLEPPSEFGLLMLAPYRVVDREHFPPYFQNRSEHYENHQFERIEAALQEQKSAPGRTLVAEFSHCTGAAGACQIAMVARSADLSDPSQPLSVEILGVPISQPTQHFTPAFTQAIFEPYLGYSCVGEVAREKIVLAPAVGFFTDESWILNHSFLAPYRRELKLRCGTGGRVEKLQLGYKTTFLTSHLRDATVPGKEQVFFLPSKK